MDQIVTSAPTFQMSVDARLIAQHLSAARIGDVIPYSVLSKLVSRDVDGSFGPLRTALNRVEKDHNIVFATIRRHGIKRLSDAEIAGTCESAYRSIRRKSRRATERLGRVANFGALPPELQAKHNTGMSLLGVVSALTTESAVKKTETITAKHQRALPMAETLKALGLVS